VLWQEFFNNLIGVGLGIGGGDVGSVDDPHCAVQAVTKPNGWRTRREAF
jgi:hypothetical protein